MPRRALLAFLATSVLSGSAFLLIKVAVEELAPVVVVWARAALGALVLLPLAARTGALRGLRARLGPLIVVAALEFAGPFWLVATGTQRIASSLTGILLAAGPLWVAALALGLDPRERVAGRRLVGLGVGLAGVALLLGVDVGSAGASALGALLVLGASASFAAGALVLGRHLAGAPPLGVVAVALALSALALTPAAALSLPARAPSAQALGAVAVLGIAITAVNFWLFFALVAQVGAARASVTTYVAPGVAVLLGVAVLGERVTSATLGGLAVIVAGSWLAAGSGTLTTRRRPAQPARA